MSDIAIRVEGLSKQYPSTALKASRIGASRAPYKTLRESLVHAVQAPFHRLRQTFKRPNDTPVKHYSSGMYVRSAFAVAAHLEPKILLVDEVLAVGVSCER